MPSKVAKPSSLEAAPAALTEGLIAYQQKPELYSIFVVESVIGIPKKGVIADFIVRAVSSETNSTCNVIIPPAFLSKNNKLVIREMGVKGAMIAVHQQRVNREKLFAIDGCTRLRPVVETTLVFTALLK